jgi:hypothetical protein
MESEGTLPSLQDPATCSYESDEAIPYFLALVLEDPF